MLLQKEFNPATRTASNSEEDYIENDNFGTGYIIVNKSDEANLDASCTSAPQIGNYFGRMKQYKEIELEVDNNDIVLHT